MRERRPQVGEHDVRPQRRDHPHHNGDYGARPLHRALESLVVTPLSHAIVGRPEWRDRRLCVDVDATGRVMIRTIRVS